MKEIIKKNLLKSSKIIKYLLLSKDKEYFGTPEIDIVDTDITNKGLVMVMFEIKFSTYADPELFDFIKDLSHCGTSLNNILKDVKIDKQGNITQKNIESLVYVNTALVSDLKYSSVGGHSNLELVLGIMFH